jgi:hypothetical protein
MLRRWRILFSMLVLATGMALVAGGTVAANASTTGTVTVRPTAINPGGLVHIVTPGGAVRGIVHQATSTNWSGYADTTGTFNSVSASWTQPAGTCSRGDQYAAFWVGIDGYNSQTVEQTGSEVDCVGRTAEYYAWYEMYPGPSQTYSDTVRAGDHFTASVTYDGGENFTLSISDKTEGWNETTEQSLGSSPALSSAEVITEAPCCTSSGGILPLTDFGTVSFTGSTANGEAIGTSSLSPEEINMVNSSGALKDECSTLTGGENFTCTWERKN